MTRAPATTHAPIKSSRRETPTACCRAPWRGSIARPPRIVSIAFALGVSPWLSAGLSDAINAPMPTGTRWPGQARHGVVVWNILKVPTADPQQYRLVAWTPASPGKQPLGEIRIFVSPSVVSDRDLLEGHALSNPV